MVLIRLKEAAKYTGLHPNTLRRYIDQGVIKGIRLGSGRHRFVEKSELDKLKGTTTEEPKGVAVYLRVSTRKQQEAGNLE
ncbi:MAG: helix-turn-helix domain-containing protein [Candidatus Jordarchaeum sp.]|uniref:helix-turn-helix domain-containing protein n=1 Tax=Candidatus Jordarchaeum sp. TaxID=2823881 RepID=UPI00404AD4F9